MNVALWGSMWCGWCCVVWMVLHHPIRWGSGFGRFRLIWCFVRRFRCECPPWSCDLWRGWFGNDFTLMVFCYDSAGRGAGVFDGGPGACEDASARSARLRFHCCLVARAGFDSVGGVSPADSVGRGARGLTCLGWWRSNCYSAGRDCL